MVDTDAIDLRIDVPRAPCALAGLAADVRARLRQELGLPSGVVTGAGHQPVVWHAGLLAKFIAASADAAALSPTGVWLHFVSDQDRIEPSRVELPVREASGAVRRSKLQCSTAWLRGNDQAAAAWYPAFSPSVPEAACASEAASEARDALLQQLRAAQREPSAALQFATAVGACAERWTGKPARVIGSAALLRAAAPLIEKVLREPERSAVAFNEALREDPHAARPLRVAGDASEVPLWGIAESGARERISAAEARSAMNDGRTLLPRAFFATGLLRLCCDCFHHGTGGARYERVGEVWWRQFFGIDLPPFGVATATLLPTPAALGIRAVPARTLASHRRLWWNPHLMTRNPTHDSARRAMVERIAHAPRRSAERAANYAALHDSIARERNAVAQQLDQVRVDESANSAALKESALAQDRTWPFLLLERASLDALAASIRHAVLRARRDPLPPPRAHPSGHA